MENAPQLASPGAGLPKLELIGARFLMSLTRRFGSPRSHNATFQRERGLISNLTQACGADAGCERVLIRRVPGMEDSSRYWSVWMVLDHLRIVNENIARVMRTLCDGVEMRGAASTAAVKPSEGASAAIVGPYEHACDAVLEAAARCPDLHTVTQYAHPWFGPMDAAGWHALAGRHMAIHRVQLERILRSLSVKRQ